MFQIDYINYELFIRINGGFKLFGIQISVLIVAVFTAFVAYQFRVREKKRETSYSELLKSYNEAYSPIMFSLKEIMEKQQGDEKNSLINKFFFEFGLSNSKAHLLGSAELLSLYFKLNTFYKAYQHEPENYEERFQACLKEFELGINEEFWDAHDIIYKEHLRYKDHSFKPVKSLFIDLLGTLKFISELAASLCLPAWMAILIDHLFKLNAFSNEVIIYIVATTFIIFLFYGLTFVYSNLFYQRTSNRHIRKG